MPIQQKTKRLTKDDYKKIIPIDCEQVKCSRLTPSPMNTGSGTPRTVPRRSKNGTLSKFNFYARYLISREREKLMKLEHI